MRQSLGSIAFTVYLFLSVPIYALLVFVTLPLPRSDPYRWAVAWAESALFMLRKLCRLSYSVAGLENLPGPGSVVLMKHSSTWETLAQLLPKLPAWREACGTRARRSGWSPAD